MPLGVFVLVLFVAVLHVIWNAILKTSGDTLRTAGRAMVVGVSVFAPIILVVWLSQGQPGFPPAVVPLGIASGFLEAAYFVSLSAAYKRGDLSEVYPIARGTAPILSVTLGVVVLGERLSAARGARGPRPPGGDPPRPPAVAGPGHAPSPRRGRGRAVGRRRGRVRPPHRGDDRPVLGGRPGRRPAGRAVALRRARLPDLRGRARPVDQARGGSPGARSIPRPQRRTRTSSRLAVRRRRGCGPGRPAPSAWPPTGSSSWPIRSPR